MPLIEAAEIVLPPARSFRDPAGFTFREDGRFLRAVRPAAFDTLSQFLSTPLARNWMESGRFVETHPLNSTVEGYQLVEHERIAFPSFPEEWPPEMLHAAGALTINLAEEALAEGFELRMLLLIMCSSGDRSPLWWTLFPLRNAIRPIWSGDHLRNSCGLSCFRWPRTVMG